MAKIRPFRAIRPAEGYADRIAALPYDVYNTEEARAAVKDCPDSFLRIDRAEVNFERGTDPYSDEVYKKAHDLLWKMVDDGKFVREEADAYYLYELTMDGRVQTGIVSLASIDDYLNGVIKKHENTLEAKEEDRIRHVDTVNAQTGPIFLAYRADSVLRHIVSKTKTEEGSLLYDFKSLDGIRHRVFKISSREDLLTIEKTFSKVNEIYIADGHHRAASAVKVGLKRREAHPGYTGEEEFNYFLSVLFPDEELKILDYNRVVKDLNGLDYDEFLASLMFNCKVDPILELGGFAQRDASDPREAQAFKHHQFLESTVRPTKKGQFSVYVNERWYLCEFLPECNSTDPVEGLDVQKLQKYVLEPVLGISDPKRDPRIDFIGGIRGLEAVEDRCEVDCEAGFAMYPTSIDELFAVADAGRLMPPKSTWFEPKLRSGLFIHELDY